MMPVMDGFEVTKILKSDLNTSHIPIILLTALDMDDKMIEGTLLGADSYITKPFSPKFLIIKINQLLEQREQLIKKYTTDPYFNKISTFSDRDKDFMEQMHQILEQHIEDPDFNVDNFAFHMKMGRTVFYKKIKGLINYSPNEYIRIVRMKKAAELLRTTDLNVGEVACKVGINDQFYFSKCFKTQFGVSPSSFQKSEVT